ncbi:hypothetical protein [Henriciella marina]|uniref:hypothetical protein n=1 Tax=Henriciella marina TaxID=453851 RepID=UPI000364BC08|nr:hypothetical protein [Henriciella marina]
MTEVPQHQEAWEHKRAIREYEDFLEEIFARMGADKTAVSRRRSQFQAIYDDPSTWREPEDFKKLYADLRREILALGALHVSAANKRLKETFGPNTQHFVEAQP